MVKYYQTDKSTALIHQWASGIERGGNTSGKFDGGTLTLKDIVLARIFTGADNKRFALLPEDVNSTYTLDIVKIKRIARRYVQVYFCPAMVIEDIGRQYSYISDLVGACCDVTDRFRYVAYVNDILTIRARLNGLARGYSIPEICDTRLPVENLIQKYMFTNTKAEFALRLAPDLAFSQMIPSKLACDQLARQHGIMLVHPRTLWWQPMPSYNEAMLLLLAGAGSEIIAA